MSKEDIIPGSSTVKDFFGWINERHRIYQLRAAGKPRPWTKDPILLDYKFTNVFRELDTGTVALRTRLNAAIADGLPRELICFNVIWYRYFNWIENIKDIGIAKTLMQVDEGLRRRDDRGLKVFTAAHMVTGRQFEFKIDTYLDTLVLIWENRHKIAKDILTGGDSMEHAFNALTDYPLIGPFNGYEMVCDLRFTPILSGAIDKFSWANIGPGAKRGLTRLGLPNKEVASMQYLWVEAPKYLGKHVMPHYRAVLKPVRGQLPNVWDIASPPFELREIEHSLCEFDKYERVRTGVGRPRQKYNGRGES